MMNDLFLGVGRGRPMSDCRFKGGCGDGAIADLRAGAADERLQI